MSNFKPLFLFGLAYALTGHPLYSQTQRVTNQRENVEQTKDNKNITRNVEGIVTDEEGEPLPGVHVNLRGGGKIIGAVTDTNGKFKISVTGKAPILHFSYISMNDKEVIVSSATPAQIKVVMSTNTNLIGEVVVTGYQTLSRREAASAITTIKAKDVLTPSAMSIDQMLQGKIAGMTVMNSSGEPSSTPTITIRGNSTINGSRSPVWVVDGVILQDNIPFSPSNLSGSDATYLIGNSISGLSPQDIESISVLKDASATAIYGVKAANGVIVITTKKGVASAPVVRYNTDISINTRPHYSQFDLMNSKERIQLSRDIYADRLRYPRVPISESFEGAMQQYISKQITADEFKQLVNHYETINTDWFDLLFRDVVLQNHNISINGGTDKVKYYTSVSYDSSPGIAIGSKSERFTAMSKLSFKINQIFDVEAKLDLSNQNNLGYNGVNPFKYAFNTSRAIPAFIDGEYYSYVIGGVSNLLTYNVLNELNETQRRNSTRRLGGMLNLNAHILPGLTYSGIVSYYLSNNRNTGLATDHSYKVALLRGYDFGKHIAGETDYNRSPIPVGGIWDNSAIESRSYTVRNTLNYARRFNKVHDVNLLGAIEVRSEKYSGVSQMAYGWDPKYGQSISPILTDNYKSRLSSFYPQITEKITQVASYIGSAIYTYNDRYVVNANIRSDGANKFGSNPKYRWLPTWSIAGKWYISNEKFMKPLRFIDNLSLRGSYGLQGNIHDDATPYLIVSMSGLNDFGIREGYIQRLPNPDLRWEKTKSYNFGIDAALFKSRLNFTLDFYRKNTTDLITDMAVSPSTGRNFMMMNAGDAVNKGWEGSVSADLIRSKKWNWNISANISHNTNEIIYALDAALTGKEKYEAMLNGNVAIAGEPLGTIYAFKYAGLSADNGYPLFYTNDGRKVHEGDFEVMQLTTAGSIFPDFSGGFDTRIEYNKNLSLSFGFSYQLGGVKRLPRIYEDAKGAFNPVQNVSRTLIDRWRQPGDETRTDIPALYDIRIADSFPEELQGRYESNSYMDVNMTRMYDYSDLRIAKSDFLRLRNITLTYHFPQASLKDLHIKGLTLTARANNLKTWASSKWQGLDPETAYANMPLMPSYSFGVNVLF